MPDTLILILILKMLLSSLLTMVTSSLLFIVTSQGAFAQAQDRCLQPHGPTVDKLVKEWLALVGS